jgi:hypothetical protein
MALFSFICYCNLKLSRSVYKRIFKDSEKSKDESDGLNNFISSDSLNRLSGDIRLLDRQLYSCSYGVISHITGITATFTYSCVILANVTSLVIVFFFILSMGLLTYFCSKFMRIRK